MNQIRANSSNIFYSECPYCKGKLEENVEVYPHLCDDRHRDVLSVVHQIGHLMKSFDGTQSADEALGKLFAIEDDKIQDMVQPIIDNFLYAKSNIENFKKSISTKLWRAKMKCKRLQKNGMIWRKRALKLQRARK